VRISRALIDGIVAHSREARPRDERGEECCGLLGGTDGEIRSVHKAKNAAATWLRFELDAMDQYRITQRIEEEDGEQVLGVYHSHTRSEAYPSQTDINNAKHIPGYIWLICSLEDYDEPVVRAFWINDGKVEEEDLDVL
jgi:proteasome lid subunit RPN8/RPN11